MSVTVTSDETFERDVLRSSAPVLVKFTAQWCPPCRMIAPVLDRISVDEAERLRVVSLDVDLNPVTSLQYQVLSLPTLALFAHGEMVAQLVGAKPRSAIMQVLEPHLGSGLPA